MNEKWYKNPEVWMLISFIFVINGFFIFGFMSEMKSAEIQAKYFNEKYGTHYTTHDFYWAGSTIRNYLTEGQQNTQNINIKGVIPVKISN
ncbi:hypothetical protein EKK58_09950 [Candidatus Dependentiae bacterium]|nr:MAG: hypothetical protein EKK58_09950 [Candidatus Dependentiae bacterium]